MENRDEHFLVIIERCAIERNVKFNDYEIDIIIS